MATVACVIRAGATTAFVRVSMCSKSAPMSVGLLLRSAILLSTIIFSGAVCAQWNWSGALRGLGEAMQDVGHQRQQQEMIREQHNLEMQRLEREHALRMQMLNREQQLRQPQQPTDATRAGIDAGTQSYRAGNIDDAARHWQTCAQTGNAQCMSFMGGLYDGGYLPHADQRGQAIRWYTLAARYGHTGAQTRLIDLGAVVPPADLRPRDLALE